MAEGKITIESGDKKAVVEIVDNHANFQFPDGFNLKDNSPETIFIGNIVNALITLLGGNQ